MSEFDFSDVPTRRPTRAAGGWGVEVAKAILFIVLGSALTFGGIRAAGYALADRETVKTIEELRAWANDPETRRRFKAATKDMRETAREMGEFNGRLAKWNADQGDGR